MRKLILALFASVLFSVGAIAPVLAANQVVFYPMENPDPNDLNGMSQNIRTSLGAFMLNAFGQTLSTNGTFSDCAVVPSSGLNVVVEPASSNQLCSLYQIEQVSANSTPQTLPAGVTGNQLPPDTTLVMIDGQQGGVSAALGPLTAPSTSGYSQYYLIEAQLQQVANNPATRLWVDGSGNPFSPTPPDLNLADEIVYQVVAGTAGTNPTVPPTDSGWISVSTVLVPHGASSITTGMISLVNAFGGFISNSSCAGCGGGGNYWYANQTIAPAGTATVSQNYGSAGGWRLQNSQWNGSTAVTHTWSSYDVGDGTFNLNYDGGASELKLDNTGDLTVQGNVTANSGLISGNHVTSNDLAASEPVCSNGSSNITTTGCNIPTVGGGSLSANVVVCTNGSGNLASCGGGPNWPYDSGNVAASFSSCATGTVCENADIGIHDGCYVIWFFASTFSAGPDFQATVSHNTTTGDARVIIVNVSGSTQTAGANDGYHVRCTVS